MIETRFKDTEIGRIPEDWEVKRLDSICEFRNGYTPSKAVNRFWENGTIPWFRMEDIRTNGRILSDAIQHINEEAVKGNLCPAGSIIMSTTATIGEHALLIVDSLANQQFTNLIIRKSLTHAVDTMWFYHYCFVLGEWCRNNINEGGLAAVNMEDFSNVIIPLPSFDEQKAIASVLSSMDDEISALEAKKAKYEQIKQGMMQQLLTGKIRLVDTVVKTNVTSANVHFRRSVLAAEIADRLCEEPTFGHVKMEKMLFLTERLCHIDIGSHYHRDAAGPYDNRALRSIDSQLKKQKWFATYSLNLKCLSFDQPISHTGDTSNKSAILQIIEILTFFIVPLAYLVIVPLDLISNFCIISSYFIEVLSNNSWNLSGNK